MMKRFSRFLFVFAFVPVLGCNEGTTGGPGVSSDKSKVSVLGKVDDTFNLSVPVLATSVQQGEQTSGVVGITRNKNFDSDVTLEFKNLPKGVTLQPKNSIIKHGDSEATIAFVVDESAPTGEFKIEVLGHPKKGADAKVEFRIDIKAKDGFRLKLPILYTAIKQGKSELVMIKVNRDPAFTQDVTLSLSDLPTGITTEPESIVNRSGEANSEFKLVAASDASLGRFAVKLKGHPTSGDDSSKEFNFVVSKDE